MDFKQINTFEKALEFKGETLEQFNERTKGMDVDMKGLEKIHVIVFALNGGKHVKEGYYPWFYNPNRSSVSFSFNVFNYDSDHAFVCARQLLETRELARYAGDTFPLEYSQYINNTND
ncbi:hypothetical protein [Sphingobacterium psychroaquaticum]|uniref:Uncharacterized protein n=1 Tax=Sphingobacterium psychroaquaticum TaxID=561061 RepID=A0A1X7K4D3_9SPHI|nr:hypothetical protein [Sphingobacterium psychroaquaticum]SMG35758.1 hypothetical protein SAMN05660862_2543 [Sphingobacterium psychroaquaticum]